MIIEVDDTTLRTAAEIHSESWRASHSGFCSPGFIALHTTEHQLEYLRKGVSEGKRIYMLAESRPVGIVSISQNLIEDLYILPSEQGRGCGTRLLKFAVERCRGTPVLWILDNNLKARRLYERYGFRATGNTHRLSDTLSELEMRLEDPES